MSEEQETWARVNAHHTSLLLKPDAALEHTLQASATAGLRNISVSPTQGKFLHLVARSIGAKRILEVGTLGGYSTIWLARALPEDGKLTTLEIAERHVEVASKNIEYAGLSSKVKIILGPATETLPGLHPSVPFELVFIDADKPNNLTYFLEAKRLVRPGGVIIVDNIVKSDSLPRSGSQQSADQTYASLLEHLKDDKEVDATAIATAGEKGLDGFLYAIRL